MALDKLALFKKLFSNEQLISVKEMEGSDNHILEINNEWICKNSKTKGLETKIQLEVKLLKLLEGKLKTRIPIVKYYEQNVLIYKKISGIELTIDFYNKLSQKQKEKLAYDIAYFLHEFHNILNAEELKKLGLTKTDWPWSPAKLLQEVYLIEDIELQEIFKSFIKDYEQIRHEYTAKLIHNDLKPENIIIDQKTGDLSGIIDFTDVAIDDPYLDLRMRYSGIPKFVESIAKEYAKLSGKIINRSLSKLNFTRTRMDSTSSPRALVPSPVEVFEQFQKKSNIFNRIIIWLCQRF